MLLIFVKKTTSRLNYAFNLVLRDIIQVKFNLTTNQEEFEIYTGPKFVYHAHSLEEEYFVQAHSLLFENGIIEQEMIVSDCEGEKVFFPS
ncbi:MAG: hypothetical protein ACJA0Q_002106, partial [Saprospiraceae bacterium]